MEWNKLANSTANQVLFHTKTNSRMIHIIRLILAQAVLNGDVDPLEVQDETDEDETTEEAEDDQGGIRDEL